MQRKDKDGPLTFELSKIRTDEKFPKVAAAFKYDPDTSSNLVDRLIHIQLKKKDASVSFRDSPVVKTTFIVDEKKSLAEL